MGAQERIKLEWFLDDMSNDTDVFVTLRSNSRINLLAAAAYLRNKDRTWRLTIDEVRKIGCNHSVRIYGWANENSLGNYWITGEDGEMGDLARKFPDVEIDGWYSDEYTKGSLYGGSKSQEFSHDEDGEGRTAQVRVGSFRLASDGLDAAMQSLPAALLQACPFLEDEHGSSIPYDANEPPCIDFGLSDECELEDEEACSEICRVLRSMGAPKDLSVNLKSYYGDSLCEQEVWEEESKDSTQVEGSEVDAFIESMNETSSITPDELLDNLGNLKPSDLSVIDEDTNENVLHRAAEKGVLNEVPQELLTLESLLRPNAYDQTAICVAFEYNNQDQLPEKFRDANLPRDYKRSLILEGFLMEGRRELVEEILDNFPNEFIDLDKSS